MDPNTIEQSALLYEALTNQPVAISSTFEEVLALLRAQQPDILVEVSWKERRDREYHDRHQLILTRLEGDRIFFINALKTTKPAGTMIGGPEQGPLRRLEASGEESMETALFMTLFALGGKALIPGQAK